MTKEFESDMKIQAMENYEDLLMVKLATLLGRTARRSLRQPATPISAASLARATRA